eukprot:g69535.t1
MQTADQVTVMPRISENSNISAFYSRCIVTLAGRSWFERKKNRECRLRVVNKPKETAQHKLLGYSIATSMLDWFLAQHLTFYIPDTGCPKKDKECLQVVKNCEPDGKLHGWNCPEWAMVDSRNIPSALKSMYAGTYANGK